MPCACLLAAVGTPLAETVWGDTVGLMTTSQGYGTAPATTSRVSLARRTIGRQSIRNRPQPQDSESVEFGRDAWPPATPSAGQALRLFTAAP
jgi:hypothetical protein